MREQQNEIKQQQSTIRKQQDEIKNQQDEVKTDVRTISTAAGGLANTIDDNWRDMSDQNCLMQKTLLDQMEKRLSKTEARDEAKTRQEQVQARDRTRERQETLNSDTPVKNVDLGDGKPTIHNVTNARNSILQEII